MTSSARTRSRKRSVPGLAALRQQLGRGRRDQQPGRGTVPGVQLLTGGRLEDHVQPERAGGDLGGRALGAVRLVGDAYGLLGQPQPGQPVPGGLDDDEIAVDHHGIARLAQIRGQRGDLAGGWVVTAQGMVVRVADGDGPVGQRGHAQRVLEERLFGGAVAVTEVEEAGADGRVHGPVPVHVPQRGRLRVGDPEPFAVGRGGKSGRLGEPGLVRRTVDKSFVGRARGDLHGSGLGVVRPQLVDTCHGDPQPVREPGDVPRGGEVDLSRRTGRRRTLPPLVAGAREGRRHPGREIEGADGVVDGVSDGDPAVGQHGESLRLTEPDLVGRAVREPTVPGAEVTADRLTVPLDLDEAVPGGVGDEEAAVRQQQGLAGEAQMRGDGLGRHVRAVAAAQRALRGVLGLQLLDELLDGVRMALMRRAGRRRSPRGR